MNEKTYLQVTKNRPTHKVVHKLKIIVQKFVAFSLRLLCKVGVFERQYDYYCEPDTESKYVNRITALKKELHSFRGVFSISFTVDASITTTYSWYKLFSFNKHFFEEVDKTKDCTIRLHADCKAYKFYSPESGFVWVHQHDPYILLKDDNLDSFNSYKAVQYTLDFSKARLKINHIVRLDSSDSIDDQINSAIELMLERLKDYVDKHEHEINERIIIKKESIYD